MTRYHSSKLSAPFFLHEISEACEFNGTGYETHAIVQALKPENPFEHAHGYFARLSSLGMQNIVDDMEYSRLPEYAWVLMQNFGACGEDYYEVQHLILHAGPPVSNFERSNWRVTPRILELLHLAYKRGAAHERQSALRREAIRAYLSAGLPAMADVLQPVPGLLIQALEAFHKSTATATEENHYVS